MLGVFNNQFRHAKVKDHPKGLQMTGSESKKRPETAQSAYLLEVSSLSARKPTKFDISFSGEWLKNTIAALELRDLSKTRLQGQISPQGSENWELTAQLGATATQSCVVTLEPVKTRIETQLRRFYSSEYEIPEDDAQEFAGDEDQEPLTDVIDLSILAQEVIALHLPAYPRTQDASLEEQNFGPPGVAPLRDEDLKPFASLSALKEKMEKGE